VLYGATGFGGTYNGGTVFSLTPPASPGAAWTEAVLHNFLPCPFNSTCLPGSLFYASTTGRLYGLTFSGGAYRAGSVYSLTPPASPGQSWTYRVLHSFDTSDGAGPDSLVLTSGTFYGITSTGGAAAAGTVFSLQP
jgi:uncharacterized repeat protein (TIGR03803 family)